MSDFTEYRGRLNIQEQIARIDRSFDEAAKFRSERTKLDAEAEKLNRERAKFDAEAAKLIRDRSLSTWQLVVAVVA